MTNKEILTECFKALPLEDRRRLKYHLDNKTPLFCGEGADGEYYSKSGFA